MDTPIANDVRAEPTGSPERPHRAVRRLTRGEPLELVARELNVTAARLSPRQDRAAQGDPRRGAVPCRDRRARDRGKDPLAPGAMDGWPQPLVARHRGDLASLVNPEAVDALRQACATGPAAERSP